MKSILRLTGIHTWNFWRDESIDIINKFEGGSSRQYLSIFGKTDVAQYFKDEK